MSHEDHKKNTPSCLAKKYSKHSILKLLTLNGAKVIEEDI